LTTQVLGNTSLDRFDALVIGSGASGGAVAEMLTRHGQKVLVLEAGSNYFPGIDQPGDQAYPQFGNDELKLLHRFQIQPDPIAEPRTFRHEIADGDRLAVGDYANFAKTVGGGATHADLKTPRFMPDDFRLGTLLSPTTKIGTSFVDWPVSYDQLEPFYLYAEHLMGVQGAEGVDPQAGPRSGSYPMPPGAAMYVAQRVAAGVAKLGYTLFPCPTAINSVPYDGRPACNDCGFCQSHPCAINAKGTPGVTTLRKALLTGNCQLRPETRAVRLLVDGAGTTITGVEAILPDGSRGTFTADQYVLAANPIEDTRLLYLSGSGSPLGNASGLVGRNLMLHHGVNVLGVFEDQLHGHRGRGSTHAFTDFRKPSDQSQPVGGIVVVTTVPYLIQQALTYRAQFGPLGVKGALLKKMLRQARPRDRLLSLSMYGEDAPQPTNTVDLDPAVRDIDGIPVARITYKQHNGYEGAAEQFYVPKMIDILGAAGARFGAQVPNGDPPSSGHIMGTLRFGTDPRTSVCRPDGRFHDIGNLYGTGASLFPTSSGFNPTLTITTLATYVAASMVFSGSPQRALT
jgi:choline dehydrogenase-like flavoprotein